MLIPQRRPKILEAVKWRFRLRPEVRRQASKGPTPVKKRSNRPIGIITELKKGGPTVTLDPVIASEITGNMVPQNIANVAERKRRLLRRKPPSLDIGDSYSFWVLSSPNRLLNRIVEKRTISTTNPKNTGPIGDWANAWTEETTPLRVKNVP